MIVFDLKCGQGHVFEAWFGSSAAWEEQRAGGLVSCPVCGDADVAKAVMAPNVAAKGNRRAYPAPAKPSAPAPAAIEAPPEVVKAAMAALAEMQSRMLENSQWVGMSFADKARAMHEGDEPTAPIHGHATPEQAKELLDDGVPVSPLPFPVIPPDACN